MLHKEEVQEGGFVTQKIPKVAIELLIGAKTEEKEKVGAFLDELNKQINSYKPAKTTVRVLYHLRPEDMTEEEQDEWLRDNAHSVYMVFAPKDRKVASNYIKTLVEKLKSFEKSLLWFKQKVELKSKYVAKKEALAKEELKSDKPSPMTRTSFKKRKGEATTMTHDQFISYIYAKGYVDKEDLDKTIDKDAFTSSKGTLINKDKTLKIDYKKTSEGCYEFTVSDGVIKSAKEKPTNSKKVK